MRDRQNQLMEFDPRSGDGHPYPSHAQQFRDYRGLDAWIYNPWTGEKRDTRDIASDPTGVLIEND